MPATEVVVRVMKEGFPDIPKPGDHLFYTG